jgi:competence protein ComEA
MKGIMFFRSFIVATLMVFPVVSGAQVSAPQPETVEIEKAVVNINHDDAETIAEVLDGVGMSRAQAIISYREENGPFASIEELAEVKGIGEQTVARNSDRITLE